MGGLDESVVEEAALAWLAGAGWQVVNGLTIAPEAPDAERGDFREVFLNGRLRYTGSPRGELPYYDAGTLGGFLNLSGFAPGQLSGDDIQYASLRAERIIGRLPLGLRGDMRVGAALEAARVGGRFIETERGGILDSWSLYVGGETPIGMVYLGYGRSTSGPSNVYLFVGTP